MNSFSPDQSGNLWSACSNVSFLIVLIFKNLLSCYHFSCSFSPLRSISAFHSLSFFPMKDDASLNSIVRSIFSHFDGKVTSWESQINGLALQFIQFWFCEVLDFLTGAWKYFWYFAEISNYTCTFYWGANFSYVFTLYPLSLTLNDYSLILKIKLQIHLNVGQ